MRENESILDKIISSKQAAIINEFNPKEIVEILIKPLSERERQIITLRHGFNSEGKKTLEKIGSEFQVTRERIRQIENAVLNKIKKNAQTQITLETAETVFNQTLENHGGIMPEELLLNKTLNQVGNSAENKTYTYFILTQLLSDRLHYLEETEEYYPCWKLPVASFENFQNLLSKILESLSKLNEPLPLNKILDYLQKTTAEQNLINDLDEAVLSSYLQISKKIKVNPFGEWGLSHWQTITLKKISDKVFLILKKENHPLHFTEIAKRINEIGFDKKTANPATIHNELILDDKYVLVGRGTYALKEWGYEPGTVAEVIESILKNTHRPLSRHEIIEEVLKKRLVKESTIILALMNKNKFTTIDDKGYILKP